MPANPAEASATNRWTDLRAIFPAPLVLLLGLGLILRLLVLFAYQRDYPLQQDFFIYFEMADSWLHGKGPRLDFLYNYLHFPARIQHVEDYYEPFYSLLVAGFMALGQGSFLSSLLLPLTASTTTIAVTWHGTRRLTGSAAAALMAAGMVCLHPLMIERGSWLMKEALIGGLYAGLWLYLLHTDSRISSRQAGLLGVLVAGIGMLQYESMPILGAVTLCWLLGQRRWRQGLIFAAISGSLMLLYWLWFDWQSGLPVSTKYLFLLTPYSGAPFAAPRHLGTGSVLAKLTAPGLYMYRSTLAFVGLPLIFCAGRGLWLLRQQAATRWLLWLLPVYLYIHGVAVDLWFQDYLALLLLLFPYASFAILDGFTSPDWDKTRRIALLLPLAYGLGFWLLSQDAFSDRIFYAPLYHSRMLVPLAFALLLVLFLQAPLGRVLGQRRALGQALSLLLLALLLGDYLRLKPLPELFVQPNEDIYLTYKALGEFVDHQLPPEAVVIGPDPFAAHFFCHRQTLQLAEASELARYRPDFAVLSRAELTRAGFQPRLFRQYAGWRIWRLHD